MNRRANLRNRLAVWVVVLAVTGAVWDCTTVWGEAQPEFPVDGAVIVGEFYPPYPAHTHIYTPLDFIPGPNAVEHTGYFSDNYDDVANRAEDANLGPPYTGPYQWLEYRYFVGLPPGMVPGDPYSDGLVRGTKYYWTVDERDVEGNMLSGEIWEFTILDFKAFAPSPPNEGSFVPSDVLLAWKAGYGAMDHDIYLGTEYEAVRDARYDFNEPGGSAYVGPDEYFDSREEPNVAVTGLPYLTEHFWRVDEVNGRLPPPFGGGTYYYGPVWNFTTAGGEAQPEFPADGAVIDGSPWIDEYIYTRLDFIPGASGVKHTGYFSDNYDDVANRIEDANLGPPPFAEEPGYEYRYYVGLPPGTIPGDPYTDSLVRGTKYYWTVDERDAEGQKFPGEIWEFTILGFYAFEPSPPNEAPFVETDVLLSWQPGYGADEHDVYMGTSWEDVNNAFLLPFPPPEFLGIVSEPNIAVTGLEFNTTYYWRVDEIDGWRPPPSVYTIYKGQVWSFTTKPSPIYVDVDAAGANNGTSWENAYNFLQDALIEADFALKPVEIRVAQGVYKPAVYIEPPPQPPGGDIDKQEVTATTTSREATFKLINGVAIKGGYAGFGEPDPNARDIEAYETILSGDLAGNDADVNEARELFDDPCRAENSYHVVVSYHNDSNAVLDGFTVTSGNANGTYYNNDGGGIYCELSSPIIVRCRFGRNTASFGGGMFDSAFISTGHLPPPNYLDLGKPVLTNCTFIMNAAEGSGGGMFNCDHAEPTVTNCDFIDNWAEAYGGGMYNGDCNSIITNCTFIGNSTYNFGGGMYNRSSNPIVTGCTFRKNWAPCGGGMYNRSSNPIVTGCTFRKNWTVDGGGGMDNQEDSSPIVTNCLFVENEALDGGGGMFSWESSPRLINCTFSCNWSHGLGGCTIFGSHSYTLTNCIIWGDWLGLFGHELGGPAVVTYSNVQGGWPGLGNIDTNPCFIEPGLWADPCNTPGDYIDDIWVDGDYHLKSQAGRWDANSDSWVQDNITSPCIDASNPGCPVGAEPESNGNRRNMGAYGGTAKASKSPANWRSVADSSNDWIVDSNDLKIIAYYWLEAGQCIPSDFDRNEFADFNDFSLFGNQWSEVCVSGRNITYDIGECIPVESDSASTEEEDQTRFAVTVEGPYILFEDMMRANYCTPALDMQMAIEGDLIMLHELAHTMYICDSICDHIVTARLGPFEPGTYTIGVYQNEAFIGGTAVTIGPAD
jgi:hypothetical protein